MTKDSSLIWCLELIWDLGFGDSKFARKILLYLAGCFFNRLYNLLISCTAAEVA